MPCSRTSNRRGRGRPLTLFAALSWLCQVPPHASAQLQDASTPIRFQRYSVDEGLPQSGVGGIAQDGHGYLWLATQDGLTRFDGYAFKTFRHDPSDPNSLPSNQLATVLIDGAGDLWVTSSDGVRRVRAPFPGRMLDLSNVPHLDSAALDDALLFEVPESESGAAALDAGRSLVEDEGGRIWISVSDETAYWDPERGKIVSADLADRPARAQLPEGVLAVVERERVGRSLRVDQWLRDREGIYWIAFANPWELMRFDPESEEARFFRHDPVDPESLGAGEIFAIFEDRWGELWVGTGRGGLNRVVRSGVRFTHIANIPGAVERLPSNYITGIATAPDGGLWIGTDNGLQRIEPDGSSGPVLTADGAGAPLADAYVRAVATTASGSLFVGAGPNLHRVDAVTGASERLSPPDEARLMSAGVTVDELDRVWAAYQAPDGDAVLFRLDSRTGTFEERYLLADAADLNPSSVDLVQSLHVRGDSAVWAGTWEQGLFRLDLRTGSVDHLTAAPHDPTSLPHNTVQVITRDRGGTLWVGTRGGGMAAYDPDSGAFRRVGTAEGLANDVVYGIVVDDEGYLWVSTNRGLSRYDVEREAFRSFDVSDGLQSNEFNRWAYAKAPDGELAFGGINGVTRFYPSLLEPNTLPPLVCLETLSVGNQPVAQGRAAAELGHVTLAHHQNLLTFEYVGLHSTDPTEIRYSYRLEGVEDAWVDGGNRRFVNYANLAPGEYTFRVRAETGAGVWSDEDYALAVTILPPFWLTWWFITLASAASAALLFAGHRYRIATLLREEQIRTRIARDLHDDVSATLSSVAYFAETIRDDVTELDDPKAERFLGLISQSAAEARDRIADIIWAISPEHQSWESLLARIRRYASDTLDSHGIGHRIELPEAVVSKPLSPDRRKHLWLILKEMTANATRHSRCGVVRIALTAHGKRVRFTFEDDGVGFDAEAERIGNGVSNIFARAQELDAAVTLETGEGLGTRWDLEFRA